MNKTIRQERAKYLLPFIQAYAEGKLIYQSIKGFGITYVPNPSFSLDDEVKFFISEEPKPEPKFKAGEWVKYADCNKYGMMRYVAENTFREAYFFDPIQDLTEIKDYAIEGYLALRKATNEEISDTLNRVAVRKGLINSKQITQYIPSEDMLTISNNVCIYKQGHWITPEPKYRPFTTEYAGLFMGKTIKPKKVDYVSKYLILCCDDNGIIISGTNSYVMSYQTLLENYTFLDGSPCGVKIEGDTWEAKAV